MRNALVVAIALGIAAAGHGVSSAATNGVATSYALTAKMTSRQVVTIKNKPWKVPPSVASARGTFVGTFDDQTRKLTWRITYKGIGKSVIVVADIHVGPQGRFGRFIVRLCSACKSGQKGTKFVKRPFITAITSGNSWVTVKTDRYPNGVIRGQIKVR